MSISIVDSGVGGLTVWRDIAALSPQEATTYVGDSLHCPYGTKTEEEIWTLTQALVAFSLTQKTALVVIACNTITVVALEKLRSTYPNIPFVGTVPAIKTAVAQSVTKRIGVLSTLRTAESSYQKRLIEQFASDCFVLNKGTDKLVPLVERGELTGERVRSTLQEVLQPFLDARIDTLVLGCTHFPFLRTEMQAILGSSVTIIDSGTAIARQVKRLLDEQPMRSDPSDEQQFFTSGDPAQMGQLLHALGKSATVHHIPSLL